MTERSPFTEPVDDQPWRGEATRFTEAVLQRAGIGYELQYLPWRRAYRYVSSEPGVLIYPLARSEPREESFQWVGQLIPVNYYLFRLKSMPKHSMFKEHVPVVCRDEYDGPLILAFFHEIHH